MQHIYHAKDWKYWNPLKWNERLKFKHGSYTNLHSSMSCIHQSHILNLKPSITLCDLKQNQSFYSMRLGNALNIKFISLMSMIQAKLIYKLSIKHESNIKFTKKIGTEGWQKPSLPFTPNLNIALSSMHEKEQE